MSMVVRHTFSNARPHPAARRPRPYVGFSTPVTRAPPAISVGTLRLAGVTRLLLPDQTGSAATARKALVNQSGVNESITAAFERVGKGKVTYSHRQHTKAESRFVSPHF
jgi:hypothetical protein